MRKTNRIAWIALSALSLPLAAWAVSASASGPNPLQARAEAVFAYDRAHPHHLPAHEVRALAIAIAFHDDDGARQLIDSFETRYPVR